MSDVLILVPAAGQSRRMGGRDKLLETIEGESLLRRQVRRAVSTGGRVLVTLPRGSGSERAAQLVGLNLMPPLQIDASEGMGASLRAGAAAAEAVGAVGLMVLLPDMPDIDTFDINRLLQEFLEDPENCVRATTEDGKVGHPVVFPARTFGLLRTVRGDKGGRSVLSSEAVRDIPLSGRKAVIDLDTPEAWAEWRQTRKA
nr:nucleotidyltransferase family protein [Rhodovulum sp. P5]